MKKIYIIALISAAVCGVLLYSFFSGYEKKQEQVAETQVQETEQVVVAVKDIKGYTEIKSNMVQLISVPAGSSHSNAAHNLKDVIGKITEREIASGQQILNNKIYKKGDSGNSLSYQIPKGMRAMTIAVDLQQDVAGYLSEGDLIDIITTPVNSKNNKKFVALSSVKILKIGEVTAAGAGNVNTNITLLLTPKQCLVMSGLSNFNITLRQKTDNTK